MNILKFNKGTYLFKFGDFECNTLQNPVLLTLYNLAIIVDYLPIVNQAEQQIVLNAINIFSYYTGESLDKHKAKKFIIECHSFMDKNQIGD